MKISHAIFALSGAITLTGTVHAADFKAGDWDMSVGGIVNAYYTQVNCSGDTVAGAALAGKGLGCGGLSSNTTIGNGLLPNYLAIGGKSLQEGYTVEGKIGIGAAVATQSAIAQNSAVDVRQGYLSFGNADMGTVKLGRDYGIFGLTTILTDMTLLGSGAPVQATQNGRVALGHIGAGYTYPGTYGQVAYSTPASSPIQFTGALVSAVNGGTSTADKGPGVQAEASYSVSGLKVWLGGKSQKFDNAASPSFTMSAIEVGGTYTIDALSLLANYQSGKGIGILADADEGNIRGRNYLLQATYKATSKAKVGISYGSSENTEGAGLKSNTNATAGLYYSLTKSLTLVGELSQTQSKDYSGNSARMSGVSIGGILFF